MAKEGKMDKAEAGTGKGEMVSPLSYQGRKGGNSESPALEQPEDFTPPDPMGFLPGDAKGKGKRGGA